MSAKSMFTMEDANEVNAMPLERGQAYLTDIVEKSSANRANKVKALQAIRSARLSRDLTFIVSSYVMAHPENGLKVI